MLRHASIWKKAIPVVVFVTFGVGIALYIAAKSEGIQPGSEPDLMRSLNITTVAGKVKAPDFVLKELKGKNIRLSDLQGNIVMIKFWTTW